MNDVNARKVASKDIFQRLVALVALVFCLVHSVGVIHHMHEMTYQETNLKFRIMAAAAATFNSSVILFIYLIASCDFRNDFYEFIRCARITE